MVSQTDLHDLSIPIVVNDNNGVQLTDNLGNAIRFEGDLAHHEIPGRLAHRTFNFMQPTDPALDPENGVIANHTWVDTTNAVVDQTSRLNVRNDANTDWIHL